MTQLLTIDQLATHMQVKRRTVIAWVRRGIIPVVRPSPKVLRFDPEAVKDALTVHPQAEVER